MCAVLILLFAKIICVDACERYQTKQAANPCGSATPVFVLKSFCVKQHQTNLRHLTADFISLSPCTQMP
tara:strand:- start:165 stop:371 length:207 start_codon:yes stop_codon:yes gene_type:complete